MARRLTSFQQHLTRRMLVIAVVPTLVLACLTVVWLRHMTIVSIERQQQYVASRAANAIRAQVTLALQTVRQLAAISQGLGPTQTTAAAEAALRQVGVLQAIISLDAEAVSRGVALHPDFSSREGDLLGLDLSSIVGAIREGDSAESPVSGAWTSPLTGRPALLLVASSPGGATVGLVDPRSLLLPLQQEIPKGYFAALLEPHGTVVANLARPADRTGEIADGRRIRPGQVLTSEWDGVEYMLATSEAPATPWYLVVGTPRDAAMDNLAHAELWTIAGGVLVAACASVLAIWLARRSARPIAELASDIRDIERTGERHVSGDAFGETQAIAQVVRQMAHTLRDRDSRLQHLASTIETAARGSEHVQGEPYMAGLVGDFLLATQARCVIAAEWLEGVKPRARIIAAKTNIDLQDDFTYDLTGHPSLRVSDRELLYFRSDVSRHYPESPLLRLTGADGYIALPLVLSDGRIGGHIEVINDHEIVLNEHVRNLLLLLSTRGSAELQRMHVERQVLKSELLYATLNLDQEEIVARWVIDGTITFVNDAFCRFAHAERSSLIGRSLLSFVPDLERERFRNRALELSSVVPTRRCEQQLLDGSGEAHWFDWHYRSVPDSKGRINEFQGTGRNITQLRNLMDELEQSRGVFAALADHTASAFWLTEPATHKCIYANPRFEEIWGISNQQMLESPMAWSVAVHESERAVVVRNFLLHSAEGQHDATYNLVRPDGTTRRIHDRAIALRRGDGQVYLVASIATDITNVPSNRPLTV